MNQAHQGTALITGASMGIGAIYADRLARRGYNLILVARNRERLNALAERITNDTRQSVEVVDADLNDREGLARVEAQLKQDASITLLVNNAGVGTHKPLHAGEEWDAYESARRTMAPHLSTDTPAPRYRIAK